MKGPPLSAAPRGGRPKFSGSRAERAWRRRRQRSDRRDDHVVERHRVIGFEPYRAGTECGIRRREDTCAIDVHAYHSARQKDRERVPERWIEPVGGAGDLGPAAVDPLSEHEVITTDDVNGVAAALAHSE